MRPVSQGTARRADARAARRARADGGARRGRGAARTARLIGAIVAGGSATRLGGEPKGLIAVGGTRIVDRIHAALGAVTDDVIVICNDPDVARALSAEGMRVVGDVRAKRGSLVGIHTALATTNDDVLAVAWDMPFVTAGLFRVIRDRFTHVDAAIPETNHGLEPLCAAYSRACLPRLDAAIDGGQMRLSAFVDSLPAVRRIGVTELAAAGAPERLFFNVNTPADVAEAERMARGA